VRSREQPWPALILGLMLAFAGFAYFMYRIGHSPFERASAMVAIIGLVGFVAFDILRCRSVELGDDALVVGGKRFAWADLDVPHFREVPLARAGMFVRVSDEARARMKLPPPRHRDYGFGLAPAPNAEAAAKRYDLFLRARRDRLEMWHDIVMVRMLQRTQAILDEGVQILAKVRASNLQAFVVSDDSTGVTIQLLAPSIEALNAHAKATLSEMLPDDAKWNPQFARGVMVFVGPLSLGKDPRAEDALAQVKATVKSIVSGTPRMISALWVEPKR
jgi:hypothetical protein